MTGESQLDPEYVLARRVLLDALDALGDHRTAVVLVGAQAIYHHTGAADLAVAEFTTDADLALIPGELKPLPKLEDALRGAGFELEPGAVGSWSSRRHDLRGTYVRVKVDLMVPEALGGPGKRGARLGEHGDRAARKAKGLEAALVDRAEAKLGSLAPDDPRSFQVSIAGPGALLVAKMHKIYERIDDRKRSSDKDALDVFRLLKALPTADLAGAIRRLRSDARASAVTQEAETILRELFSTAAGRGSLMTARALQGIEPPDVILGSIEALTRDLLRAVA